MNGEGFVPPLTCHIVLSLMVIILSCPTLITSDLLALEVFLVIPSKSPFIAYSPYIFLVLNCAFPMACTAWYVPQVLEVS